ncbi:hypothetical protein X798_04357 [Onchocerca flexuosa]|uniref:Guanylate cyclase domain-containing protein n=1 Tax=Onchocerca flexuosa TaxID=387005 RepID=A0A238BUU1_9BILA|nr:hypothetical protein X798_04357 [Onchocerca flexuosa]
MAASKKQPLINSGEYQEVTIMFDDIPNFDNIAVSYKPEEAITLLNELFMKLDRLACKHSIFKVETIDDTNLTAKGAPKQTNNSCEILYHGRLA